MKNNGTNYAFEETFIDIIHKITSEEVCNIFIQHCEACKNKVLYEVLSPTELSTTIRCVFNTKCGKRELLRDSIVRAYFDKDILLNCWCLVTISGEIIPLLRTVYKDKLLALSPYFNSASRSDIINMKFVFDILKGTCILAKRFDNMKPALYVSKKYVPLLKQKLSCF